MRDLTWIRQYVKTHKWWFLFGFFLTMMEILANLSSKGVQKWIIDDVFMHGKYDRLVFYLILFGGAMLSEPFLFTFVAMVQHKIGYSMRVDLAKRMMSILYKIPVAELQKQRSSSYTDYITNDVSRIGEEMYKIPLALQQIVLAICLMSLVGFQSLFMLLLITGLTVLYIALGRYFSGKMRTASRQVQDHKTDLVVHIEESIASTREVIAYHRMEWIYKKYNQLFERYFSSVLNEGRLSNKSLLLTDPLKWVSNLFVLFYGAYHVIKGQMTIGTLVVLYQFASQLIGCYQQIYGYYTRFAGTMASVDRLSTITEAGELSDGDIRIQGPIASLEFHNVSFNYQANSEKVIKDFTLSIPIGKKVAFVGTSGGGKSTIAKLLIRYFEPVHGKIRVNGHSLSEICREDWHQRVAITFQEPFLFPDSVRNNITFGRKHVSEEQLQSVCELVLLEDLIQNLPDGYETEVGERGISLSGGQRQRLAMARAILCNPEILLLDEATSALDLETERKIQRNLDEIRQGLTTIVIAHRLSTIHNADLIVVLHEGCVIGQGTHDQLMKENSFYKQMVYSQNETSEAIA